MTRFAEAFHSGQLAGFPMDTSHLAEHAGTAGSFFASVFVVATLSMRTMIPLRVFAILTNIVLIATAIPSHNYPIAGAALRCCCCSTPIGCTRCCSWCAT